MNKNVLVLGGFNGFLGKALVRHGKEHGYHIGQTFDSDHMDENKPEFICGGMNFYGFGRSELNLLDAQLTRTVLKNIKPDIVLYTAAKCGGVFDNLADPFGFWHENTLMALNTLKAVKESAVPAFVAVLSSCIYPAHVDGWEASSYFDDDSDGDSEYYSAYPLDTTSIYKGQVDMSNIGYGAGKRALLDGMISLSRQSDTKFNALVPCNMFGVGDSSTHFIPSLMKKLRETPAGEPIVLHGTGQEIRQFMDVDDFVGCTMNYLQNLWNPAVHMGKETIYGKVWIDNVAPDNTMTVAEAAQRIVNIVDPTRKIEFNNSDNCQFRKDIASDVYYKWTEFDDTIRKILV